MNEQMLKFFWEKIPTWKENAISYDALCFLFGCKKRRLREILHELSTYDNGDNMILIRSSKGGGFYKTDNPAEIEAYRREVYSRGKHVFAPLRKINRVLAPDGGQLKMTNNLKTTRLALGMMQTEVCAKMKQVDPSFDVAMLSRMENDRCLPTPFQLAHLAAIYGCTAVDLVDVQMCEQTQKTS